MRWWIKLIFGLIAIAILAFLAYRISTFTLNVLKTGETSGEPDPMFAVEEPTLAPPDEETEEAPVWQDNSASWNQENHTPVDQSAAELEADEREKQ